MIIGRKKTWTLDHSYGGFMPNGQLGPATDELDEIILEETRRSSIVAETSEEKRLRKRSHWVVYTTMCFLCIGFSIVISGVFPYLKLLEGDDHLSKTYLGWVIASNPVGMLIAAPSVGRLANYLGSIRSISLVSMVAFVLANILYGALPSFVGLWPRAPFHVMLFARFVIGVSSGVMVVCRSYLASATLVQERTTAFSIMSAAQSLGYIIGPVIQMGTSLVIKTEIMKYQATGYISAVLGVINFILMTPYVFQEIDIAAKEREKALKISGKDSDKSLQWKPDVPALLSAMLVFFLGCLIYILLETLLEPLVQDQYAWCDDLAVVTVGVILSAVGVVFLFLFLVVPKVAKIVDERKLLCGALVVTVLGLLSFQPVGHTRLKYCSRLEVSLYSLSQNSSVDLTPYETDLFAQVPQIRPFERDNTTVAHQLFQRYCTDEEECLGCPPHQLWCLVEPQIPLSQVITSFAIVLVGFPINMCISSALFSKMLGPMPQGTWMGWMSAAGSLARILGPVYVSYVYTYLGSRYTFGFLALIMAVGTVVVAYFYKRLVPLTLK